MNLTDPDDRDLACAEYVIGLMEADDHEAFERRLSTDAELVAGVARWREQLSGFNAQTNPVDPSPYLWPRIESALPGQATVSQALHSRAQQPRQRPQPRQSLWNSLALWRTISAAAVAASIAMFALVTQPQPEVRVYVALLKSPEQATGWLVQARELGTIRLVPLNPQAEVAGDKTLQLWTQLAGADAPISVALIEAGAEIELSADQLPGLGPEQLFAISLEPAGGSPTGLPTGPILFAGNTEPI